MAGDELASPDSVWPAQYAISRGLAYENLARTGCSVQYVLRTLLSHMAAQTESCFYVIHWPTSIRYEYVNKDDDSWIQISPNTDNTMVNKIYYSEINSYLGDKWNALSAIFSAQQALQLGNHKFAMSVDDDFLYQTQWHNPDYVQILQRHTQDSIMWFEDDVWSVWAKKNNFPHGCGNHPLEAAHNAAISLLESAYDNILESTL
jgi:hypothetical protein